MGKHHPRQSATAKLLVAAAAGHHMAICWWCGSRPLDNQWQADHIAPTEIDSHIIVACRKCNRVRQGLVPTARQWQRLLHDENIVRSCNPEDLLRWLDNRAQKRFPDENTDIARNVLVAKVYRQPMYYAGPTGRPARYARRENKLWEQLTNTQDKPIQARMANKLDREIEYYHGKIRQDQK